MISASRQARLLVLHELRSMGEALFGGANNATIVIASLFSLGTRLWN